jgi:hypothetical protein
VAWEDPRTGAPKVFLSYGRGDDRKLIDAIERDLQAAGFAVWRDEGSMPSRGRSFIHELRVAIEQADRIVLAVGPAAMRSEHVLMEWQYALTVDRVVVPVWLSSDFRTLPPELANLHAIRLDVEGTAGVIRRLREDPPPLGQLHGVPQLPPHYRPRPDLVSKIAATVLFDHDHPVVLDVPRRRTVISGMGGSGKSVIATAFARGAAVRRTFVDGVFWFNARSDLTGAEVKERVLRQLQSDSLAGRTCLVVLDNVETIAFVEPISQVLGPNCRLLITARDRTVATGLGAEEVRVSDMSEAESLALIADWTRTPIDALPSSARDVVVACGGNAHALALAGAYLSSPGGSYDGLLAALASANLEFMRLELIGYEYESVMRVIEACTSRLAPEGQRFFGELAALDRSASIPAGLVRRLWLSGGLPEDNAGRLLIDLEAQNLVRIDGGRVSLHDLQHLYLRAKGGENASVHERMLGVLGWPAAWSEATSDPYLFEQLSHHLVGAKRHHELVELLTQGPRWMRASLAVLSDVRAVRADVTRALEGDTSDAELVRLHAVRRAARTEATRYSPDALRALVCLGDRRLALSCARLGTPAQRLAVIEETKDPALIDETIDVLRTLAHPDPRARYQANLAVIAGPRSQELFDAAARSAAEIGISMWRDRAETEVTRSAAEVGFSMWRDHVETEVAICLMRAGRFEDAAKIAARIAVESAKAELRVQKVWRLAQQEHFDEAEKGAAALEGQERARALLGIVRARKERGDPAPSKQIDELYALAHATSAEGGPAQTGLVGRDVEERLALALAALGHFDDQRYGDVLGELIEGIRALASNDDHFEVMALVVNVLAAVDSPKSTVAIWILIVGWDRALRAAEWVPNLYPLRRSLAVGMAALATRFTREDEIDRATGLADMDLSDLHGCEILDAIALEAARRGRSDARAALERAVVRRDMVANVESRAAIIGDLAVKHREHRVALLKIAKGEALEDPRALHALVKHLVTMKRFSQALEVGSRIDHDDLKASASNAVVMGFVRAGKAADAGALINGLLQAHEPRKIKQTMALAWLGGALAEAGWLKQALRMPTVVEGSAAQWRIDADIARRRFTSALRRVSRLDRSIRSAPFCKIASALAVRDERGARKIFERARAAAGTNDEVLARVVMDVARVGYLDIVETIARSIASARSRSIAWSAATKLVTQRGGNAPPEWLAESERALAECTAGERDEPLRLLANARVTCKLDAMAVVAQIGALDLRAAATRDVADILAYQGDMRSALKLLAIEDLDEFMTWLESFPPQHLPHFWEAAEVAAWVAPVWEQVRAATARESPRAPSKRTRLRS